MNGSARRKFVAVALLAFAAAAGPRPAGSRPQWTPAELEKKLKDAVAAAPKKRAALAARFLPKARDLGPGWLAPWEVPAGIRKVGSEQEYWAEQAGRFEGTGGAFFSALISSLMELSPADREAFLKTWVNLGSQEARPPQIPAGMTVEQFALAPLLLVLKWEYAPSLADKMEMVTSYLEEMQTMLAAQAEKRFGQAGGPDAAPASDSQTLLMDVIIKPFKGMPGARLRQDILTWASAHKDMSTMTYTTCDDWKALASADAKAAAKLHLRHAVVSLNVYDRASMSGLIRDLTAAQAATLQTTWNERLGRFRDFSFDVLMRKRTAELRQQIAAERSPERRAQLEQELARLPAAAGQLSKAMPNVRFEVGQRDFGDNCYVIDMKGDFSLPELTFPATNLQACLRNGNAVVFIGLGGISTPELMKKDLDRLLSEMDARTAFYR